MTETIRIECKSCRATGVYKGFAEPEHQAVVCLECKGNGYTDTEYTRFTTLKRRDDIRTVRCPTGAFVFSRVGPTGMTITYEEFLNGARPQRT